MTCDELLSKINAVYSSAENRFIDPDGMLLGEVASWLRALANGYETDVVLVSRSDIEADREVLAPFVNDGFLTVNEVRTIHGLPVASHPAFSAPYVRPKAR